MSQLSNQEKEYLISKALETEEGRVALAQAMANPIRVSLDYQGVGRKLLVVDPLPQGALPVYDKDVDAKAFVISKRGQVPDQVIEGDRIQVPTFEIVSYPQVRFSQVKERRFNVIDRAQQRAKADIMAVEDAEIFSLLEGAATAVNAVTISSGGLQRAALTKAFQEVEKHDLVVTKIVMNASAFADIRAWGQNEFDPVTQHEVLQTGLFGHIWTADILISKKVPQNTVYVLADPEFVGVMPIRQDIQVIPADKPEELRLGWVIYEELGLAVVNSLAIAKIS
nr:Chain A, Gp27 major capsid protein [Donellivirus gee]6WKK_B Chain B, Gp27 major capsid protein [Donellivirus gee]6WKK_C Chain C, Gp27 major capsid protein [Donellivirus gee]6WKK_D Chain D, Gp27 major capsid protein [Donellivirus gee]6WKK_E Chain E, Gp27 major capsid protein [Donellivirus gee]6WKK_F Chain F, Gp27 major capsid protein [Donellivirus gee]